MHAADPDSLLYVDTAHFEQGRPFGPVWPGLHVHAETLLFPGLGVPLFAGHVVHVEAASTLAYVPALQFVQDVELCDCLYFPKPQLVHAFPSGI
jgi:hypothetical protein